MHAAHSFLELDISARDERGSLHHSHNRNIPFGAYFITLKYISLDKYAAAEINISNGIIHISGHFEYLFHMETAAAEG